MQESSGNPNAVGDSGKSVGLGQIYDPTWAMLQSKNPSLQDRTDPMQNIQAMEDLWNINLGSTGGDVQKALEMYNGSGPMARKYVSDVMGRLSSGGGGGGQVVQTTPQKPQVQTPGSNVMQAQGIDQQYTPITPLEAMGAGLSTIGTSPSTRRGGFGGGFAAAFGAASAAKGRDRLAAQRFELQAQRMRSDMEARNRPPNSYREYQLTDRSQSYGEFLEGRVPSTNINMGGEGSIKILGDEEKSRLGLDPETAYVVDKNGMPKAIKATGFTEGQLQASGYHDRMAQADSVMLNLINNGFDPAQITEHVADKAGALGNFFKSPEGQMYRQAQEDFIRAKLRKESGAVIADEEMEREIRVYFPMPGDSQKNIDQKRQAREAAREGMADMSGGKSKYQRIYENVERETTPNDFTDQMDDDEFLKWAKEE